ncbi:MAG: DUF1684 domain-containing protein [Chloroflexota bacterium]
MTHEHEHEHEEHDHDEHDGHEHHHHAMSFEDALNELRSAATHYYEHQFDWKGHGPPEGFDGPRWFVPDESWRLAARLDRDAPGTGEHVELATSTGKLRDMENAGQLVFEVGGTEQRLSAFLPRAMDAEPVLFVPFRDATSGVDTYGAGRYVDVPYDADEDWHDLDFNYAYNPSCAFSPAYDCPFPPPGNRLPISVTAGEKLPSGEAPH